MISSTKYKIKNTKSGFTFIEALVLLFIFSLITVTFYNVMTVGTRYLLISKNRLGAVALGNQKMEVIRNLKYEDIGTVGGTISGNLQQTENIAENGRTYRVETSVRYEDDPFDGTLGGSPNDAAYKDYKTVKLKVIWNNGGADQGEVELVSRFVAPGLETATVGDGILSINVFTDQGSGGPIPQSRVRITNPDVGIDETLETNNEGNIMLLGAGESIQRYQITASKSGYENVTTHPPYPDSAFNPVDVHASVIGGNLNIANLVQNKNADLRISTKDYQGNSIPDADFKLSGGRKLGTEVLSPFDPVYSLNSTDKTDSEGKKDYLSVNPGQYSFSLIPTESVYEIIGLSSVSPFSLASEDALTLEVKLGRKDFTSPLVKVMKSEDSSLIEGARVRLVETGLPYDREIVTGTDGLAFFPVSEENSFSAGDYQLTVEASGYQNHSETASVVSGEILKKEVLLISN